MASMRHPNICLFFGACFQTSPPVILLELCEGGSLELRIIKAWADGASAKQRISAVQRAKCASLYFFAHERNLLQPAVCVCVCARD